MCIPINNKDELILEKSLPLRSYDLIFAFFYLSRTIITGISEESYIVSLIDTLFNVIGPQNKK